MRYVPGRFPSSPYSVSTASAYYLAARACHRQHNLIPPRLHDCTHAPSVFPLRFTSQPPPLRTAARVHSVPAARSANAVSHAVANAVRTIDSMQETTCAPRGLSSSHLRRAHAHNDKRDESMDEGGTSPVTLLNEPHIYHNVIDDVISAIRQDFKDYCVPEDVLAKLQHKWEDKIIASRVAEFEPPSSAPHLPPYAAMQMMPQHTPVHHSYAPSLQPQIAQQSPIDNRYIRNGATYPFPLLPSPKINDKSPDPDCTKSVFSFGHGPPQGLAPIPQVDGPSENSDDSPTSAPPAYPSRIAYPSLPQPQVWSLTAPVDSETINSDLDDSDTGDEDLVDSAGANPDIVFCTYDKVAHVKSKWKCVLKDGMIHANGKDYLFSRCTGEFDWV
ncbi:Transcription initiation factor IIA large subunit [Mycena venus]|uniref:Transcription initiation factor IIA large subunit n=1 Tax=Mycena venus TaxID=2733690 RepID=A0A8H6Z7Q9_9AGAR|nr:Transcription initiation factor IIA large subunit [Mycena venus]